MAEQVDVKQDIEKWGSERISLLDVVRYLRIAFCILPGADQSLTSFKVSEYASAHYKISLQIRKSSMLCIHTTSGLIQPQTTSTISKLNNLRWSLLSVITQVTTQNVFYCLCSKKTVQLIEGKKELACELVASWSVQVGDLDQCLHLWRYTGGFEKVDLAERELKKDAVSWLKTSLNLALFRFFLGLCQTISWTWWLLESKTFTIFTRI